MNKKSLKERVRIINLLVEGMGIRAISRIENCSVNTVLSLLAEVGNACAEYQSKAFVNLPCKKIQVDEIWSFIHTKEKNDPKKGHGNIWTWVAICPDTKLVPCWKTGDRDKKTAIEFIADLPHRFSSQITLISDGNGDYLQAVDDAFGIEIDYAMVIKLYEKLGKKNGRYIGATKKIIYGNVPKSDISTSMIERQNLTMRQGIKRFYRATSGHSKKVENHAHAIALHFMHYNFCRIHSSLRITPAMACGMADRVWDIEDILNLINYKKK